MLLVAPRRSKVHIGIEFSAVLFVYIAAGVIAGFIIAVLRAVRTSAFGAFVIGCCADKQHRLPGAMIGLTIAAIFVGGFSGWNWWKRDRERAGDLG